MLHGPYFMLAKLSLIKALDELDGADIMGKAVRVTRSDNVSTILISYSVKLILGWATWWWRWSS